jgi:hypothetical protein
LVESREACCFSSPWEIPIRRHQMKGQSRRDHQWLARQKSLGGSKRMELRAESQVQETRRQLQTSSNRPLNDQAVCCNAFDRGLRNDWSEDAMRDPNFRLRTVLLALCKSFGPKIFGGKTNRKLKLMLLGRTFLE